MNKALEKKELTQLGRTDASRPLIIGRYVKDPLVMSDGHCDFSWRQYRFALSYQKTLDLNTACEASGLARDSAIRFLKKPQVRAWFADRDLMLEAKRKWSAEGRWHTEGEKMFFKEDVPKHRVEIWKEFGKRHEPEPGKNNDSLTTGAISINIAPETILAIREREKAMEAEFTQDDPGQRGT